MRPASVCYHLNDPPATAFAWTAAQTRALDAAAIARGPDSGFDLMCRAGRSAFRLLRQRWPEARRIVVSCGGGNNGGDGLVVAALAHQQGLDVHCRILFEPDSLRGEAARAWRWAMDRGLGVVTADQPLPEQVDVIVDAVLGTGLNGPVRAHHAAELEKLASAGAPVLAVDIPSGLHADTGQPMGPVVPADVTLTFIGINRGLLTGQGPAFTGDLFFDRLAVSDSIYEAVGDPWKLVVPLTELLRRLLPARSPAAHKGCFGRVGIMGGNRGMGGALLLAAGAACRMGAGLVAALTRPEHVGPGLSRWPDVQFLGSDDPQGLVGRLPWADVWVIGPGLGRDDWAIALLAAACRSGKPLVLDADALNLLAAGAVDWPDSGQWWATPHPGEAARLLGISVEEVERDRFGAIEALCDRFGGHWLLKGAGPLYAGAQVRGVVASAHASLAKGGSGDVLSGMLGALAAQGLSGTEVIETALVAQSCMAAWLDARGPAHAWLASDQPDALLHLFHDGCGT